MAADRLHGGGLVKGNTGRIMRGRILIIKGIKQGRGKTRKSWRCQVALGELSRYKNRYGCRYIHTHTDSHIPPLYPLRGPGRRDTPTAIASPVHRSWLLNTTLHSNKPQLLGGMSNSRAGK